MNVQQKKSKQIILAEQRTPDRFIDFPGAADVHLLPDIQAYDEIRTISRWESEGGKILRDFRVPAISCRLF